MILESGETRWLTIGVVFDDYGTVSMPGWFKGTVGFHTDDSNIFDTIGQGRKTIGLWCTFFILSNEGKTLHWMTGKCTTHQRETVEEKPSQGSMVLLWKIFWVTRPKLVHKSAARKADKKPKLQSKFLMSPHAWGNGQAVGFTGEMSDYSSRDHVTLPNSKWRPYLHSLFIPVERRLIEAQYKLQMHIGYF